MRWTAIAIGWLTAGVGGGLLAQGTVDFSGNPITGCAPLAVQFTALSTDVEVDGWFWDFGDGGLSNDQNPLHTYTGAGSYTVKLTIKDKNGGPDLVETKTDYITVHGLPVPDFTANTQSDCMPLQVRFTNNSTGEMLNRFEWDFGDGATSTDANPVHAYQSPGTYTVKLTAGGACGEGVKTKSGYIKVLAPPTAGFIADRKSGCAPLQVRFTDTSTGDGLTSWSWDFGDGGASSSRNPTHTYAASGNYTVRLTVNGACGSDEEVKDRFITVAITANAAFHGSPLSGCAPLRVDFRDDSTGGQTFAWKFGDGGTSQERDPRHTYNQPGKYTVELKVGGACGEAVEKKTEYITVLARTSASFAVQPSTGCAPLSVSFTNTSSGEGLSSFEWDFGDGARSQDTQPNHVYQSPGSYTVTLTARGACGEDVETKVNVVTVASFPAARFRADSTSGCAPFNVRFTDQSTGGGLGSWSWEFGDGGTSTAKNPSHTYTSPGVYSVKLSVRGTCGDNADTQTDFITVSGAVTADFEAAPTSGCAPLTVTFTDKSTGEPLSSFLWDFGDKGKAAVRSPTHTYLASGTYSVKLTVKGDCGQDVETKTSFITVAAPTVADFSAGTRSGCAPLDVAFTDRASGDALDSFRWDFGDGETSTDRNPSHSYRQPGKFTVKLTVHGSCGEDTESQTDFIRVAAIPQQPARIEYNTAAFARDIVPVKWTQSSDADQYIVEGRVEGQGDWFEVCTVDADSGLQELTCPQSVDETGTWLFRVTAVNSCGRSPELVGPPLVVMPPAILASWTLDNCGAEDVEKGNNGRFAGVVSCAADRFDRARTALRFRGTGYVQGNTLPPSDGDFTISLWVEPREPTRAADRTATTFLELFPSAGGDSKASPLRARWNDAEGSLQVTHGDPPVGAIGFTDVAHGWHHLVISRRGGFLTAYLDGAAGSPMADSLGLGNAFTLGAAASGSAQFEGTLDQVLYESRSRDLAAATDLIFPGGPTLFLDPGSGAGELTLKPGGSTDVLPLKLRCGPSTGGGSFKLEGLRLFVHDEPIGADADNPGEAFDFIEAVTLFSLSRCNGENATREAVGQLEVQPHSASNATLELLLPGNKALALPAESSTCLVLVLSIKPSALSHDRILRFGIQTPDDIQAVDDRGVRAFVAGARKSTGSSVEGSRVHILNLPPEILLQLESSGQAAPIQGPASGVELHTVSMQAGATEGIRLEQVVYEAAKGVDLSGVSKPQLFLNGPGGDELVGEGLLDLKQRQIRFSDLGAEIEASSSRRLILRADLRVADGAPPATSTAPLPLPRLRPPPAWVFLCALVLAFALPLARPWRVPRFARALCLWAVTSVTLLSSCGPVLVGAAVGVVLLSSGGGGDGGRNGLSAVATFQFLLRADSIDARGTTSRAPALIAGSGDTQLDGPVIRVERK